MDLKVKLKEIDAKITDLQVQIFNLVALKKKLERQKKDIEKLTSRADEILNQE